MGKSRLLVFISLVAISFGCKTYKNEVITLRKEKEDLQTRLTELQNELAYKETVINKVNKDKSKNKKCLYKISRHR